MTKIKLFATLRDIAGGVTSLDIPLEGVQTARDVVRIIQGAHPALGAEMLDDSGELTGKVHLLVNGRNIEWLDKLDTPVSATDTLVLIPPVAGG